MLDFPVVSYSEWIDTSTAMKSVVVSVFALSSFGLCLLLYFPCCLETTALLNTNKRICVYFNCKLITGPQLYKSPHNVTYWQPNLFPCYVKRQPQAQKPLLRKAMWCCVGVFFQLKEKDTDLGRKSMLCHTGLQLWHIKQWAEGKKIKG